jgi:hypothetical protein
VSYQQPPPDYGVDVPTGPPPGWYMDPNGLQVLRWWDGAKWGSHTQPLPGMKQEPQSPYPETSEEGTTHSQGRRRTDTRARRIFGILLLVAAPVIILFGYGNAPDAGTCNTINQINTQAGLPANCSSVPSPSYFVVAGLCVVVSFLILAPWWLRWLTGK